jgi:hypothetical protein
MRFFDTRHRYRVEEQNDEERQIVAGLIVVLLICGLAPSGLGQAEGARGVLVAQAISDQRILG